MIRALARIPHQVDNGGVAVNPATSFDRLNIQADSRLTSGIFASVIPLGATFYGGPRWGSRKARRFLYAGLSTLPSACHPRLTVRAGLNAHTGVTHHV